MIYLCDLYVFQNPQFSSLSTYVIFAHLLRQVASLSDHDHHFLVHWIKLLVPLEVSFVIYTIACRVVSLKKWQLLACVFVVVVCVCDLLRCQTNSCCDVGFGFEKKGVLVLINTWVSVG